MLVCGCGQSQIKAVAAFFARACVCVSVIALAAIKLAVAKIIELR